MCYSGFKWVKHAASCIPAPGRIISKAGEGADAGFLVCVAASGCFLFLSPCGGGRRQPERCQALRDPPGGDRRLNGSHAHLEVHEKTNIAHDSRSVVPRPDRPAQRIALLIWRRLDNVSDQAPLQLRSRPPEAGRHHNGRRPAPRRRDCNRRR